MNEFLDLDLETFFLSDTPLLDVRSEGEFLTSQIPNSYNIPILNNEQRALVGTCYKQEGREQAIQLGLRLTALTKKETLEKWKVFFSEHPNGVLTCFRGGLRSAYAQNWLQEVSLNIPRIKGGTKRLRQFLQDSLNHLESLDTLILSGLTGSRKTNILKSQEKYAFIDLEKKANHRGSIFGGFQSPQPEQAVFENHLAVELMRLKNSQVLIEDESRMIGQRVLPENLFNKMRASPIVWIEVSLGDRVQNILQDYIISPIQKIEIQNSENALNVFQFFETGVKKISKKLGLQLTTEILKDLEGCQKEFLASGNLEPNQLWIEKLLVHYYDPQYKKNISIRNPVILYRGSLQNFFSPMENRESVS